MFEATEPVLFFDHFRVPYDVHPAADGDEFVRVTPRGVDHPQLLWPAPAAGRWRGARPLGRYRAGPMPVYTRMAPDAMIDVELSGGGWSADLPVIDAAGRRVASTWRRADGSVLLPFDPGEAMANLWSEAYARADASGFRRGIRGTSLTAYYRLRPLMPRTLQIGVRRSFARLQARRTFPRWPVEPALEELYRLLFGIAAGLVGKPVPRLSLWPHGHSWAFVLTHDIETALGYDRRHLLLDIERARGYRSSWNLVPQRYPIDDGVVQELKQAGCEVGVHGLRHDGRDLESLKTLHERLPQMHEHARRWGAVGFRSPATQRVHEWMPLLGADYDSSYPDTDPFEPQSGGCCSLLPYFNGDLVELPITLPQDHTLFEILRFSDERMWLKKAKHVRSSHGMALAITHPDYMIDTDRLQAYDQFLAAFESDTTAWKALPNEVSGWWRMRAASTLVGNGGDWVIEGPAAEAGRVVFGEPGDLVA
jgi:hypothetical protein